MRGKQLVYRMLKHLSSIAGYKLTISRETAIEDAPLVQHTSLKPTTPLEPTTSGSPYNAYIQDGLMSIHSIEFLENKGFVKSYERGIKAANGRDYKWHWRVHVGLWAAYTCSTIEGDYVECGVGNGFLSSAILEYLDWNKLNKYFYLFDTFEGLDKRFLTPEELEKIGDVESYNEEMRKEVYNENYQSVESNFCEWNRVKLIKGSIPETLNSVPIEKVAYLSIDMNCVIPEIAAIEHFYPKLSIGAIALLDDYAYQGYSLQKKAMDKWAEKMRVQILTLPTGQGMLVKT